MNRSISTFAAIALLMTVPAIAMADETPERHKGAVGIGVVAGGVMGAIVGGPPGAMAGMMIAGVAADRELIAKRAGVLEDRTGALERERLNLLSEQVGLKARADELGRLLEHERQLATRAIDTASLADGLEFAVGFRTNSATPPAGVDHGLDALAQLVGAIPSLEVRLDGYADIRGEAAFNQALSQARAEAIRDRLVDAGVDAERIRVTAHGADEGESAEQASDPDGWALQRRVSIRLERREGRLAAKP